MARPPPLTLAFDEGLAHVCRLVEERLGVTLSDPDRADNRVRLHRLLDDAGCNGWKELAVRLGKEPMNGSAWTAAVAVLTIGETYFFRHRAQFEHLRDDILRPLIAARTALKSPWLRMWSAGCSSGEEAYSLAILVAELIPDLQRWEILILGTDVNPESIEKARVGRYGPWSLRDSPEELKERNFTRQGDCFQVRQEVKKMVRFATRNLLEDSNDSRLSDLDVVLCRNVIVYFPAPQAEVVVRRVHDALRPGGSLLVGPSEPQAELFHQFEPIMAEQAMSYRLREAPVRHARPAPETQLPAWTPRPSSPPPSTVGEAQLLMSARNAADGGHHEEALRWCFQVLATDAGNAEAYYLLGAVRGERDERDEAIKMLRKAVYLEPNFALACYALGHQLRLAGDLLAARRWLQTARWLLSALAGDSVVRGDPALTVAEVHCATDFDLLRT